MLCSWCCRYSTTTCPYRTYCCCGMPEYRKAHKNKLEKEYPSTIILLCTRVYRYLVARVLTPTGGTQSVLPPCSYSLFVLYTISVPKYHDILDSMLMHKISVCFGSACYKIDSLDLGLCTTYRHRHVVTLRASGSRPTTQTLTRVLWGDQCLDAVACEGSITRLIRPTWMLCLERLH